MNLKSSLLQSDKGPFFFLKKNNTQYSVDKIALTMMNISGRTEDIVVALFLHSY